MFEDDDLKQIQQSHYDKITQLEHAYNNHDPQQIREQLILELNEINSIVTNTPNMSIDDKKRLEEAFNEKVNQMNQIERTMTELGILYSEIEELEVLIKMQSLDEQLPEEHIITNEGHTILGVVKTNDNLFSPTYFKNNTEKGHLLCLVKMVGDGVVNIVTLGKSGPEEEFVSKIKYMLDRLFLLNPIDIVDQPFLISIDAVTNVTQDREYANYHQDHVVVAPFTGSSEDLHKLLFRINSLSSYTFLQIIPKSNETSVGTTFQFPTTQVPLANIGYGSQVQGSQIIRYPITGETTIFFTNNMCYHSVPYSDISCVRGISRIAGNKLLRDTNKSERHIQRLQVAPIVDVVKTTTSAYEKTAQAIVADILSYYKLPQTILDSSTSTIDGTDISGFVKNCYEEANNKKAHIFTIDFSNYLKIKPSASRQFGGKRRRRSKSKKNQRKNGKNRKSRK